MEVVQTLWFANGMDAALTFYTSLIPGSGIDAQWTMAADSPAGPAGSVRVATFHLGDQWYQAMEAGDGEPFTPAFSITLLCDDQAEVDRLWSAIADAGGTPVECGWIRDRWGLSWQIVPRRLIELMSQPDKEAARRTAEAMMRMVKFDIASLEAASAG
ncbi:VOC family protein [Haematobacter genomosp. 1]|uniref:PhnB-like domain-containing protein n=1 Tax=Haematobacter genomosp. 1 TaxID=366618 RepID=A0A212A742_9RHOB|nr:VOC family protein [Haematobacter genomosp. 1]OWJ75194.1 hypothetical protein CDV49_17640 [Haematobacter genomosp. 1]